MKILSKLFRFVTGLCFVRTIFGIDDALIAAFIAPLVSAGIQKMTAPKGGPGTGMGNVGQPVGFLDGLVKGQQGTSTPPLQPQQFQPLNFKPRAY